LFFGSNAFEVSAMAIYETNRNRRNKAIKFDRTDHPWPPADLWYDLCGSFFESASTFSVRSVQCCSVDTYCCLLLRKNAFAGAVLPQMGSLLRENAINGRVLPQMGSLLFRRHKSATEMRMRKRRFGLPGQFNFEIARTILPQMVSLLFRRGKSPTRTSMRKGSFELRSIQLQEQSSLKWDHHYSDG
jgi:hypothetical protein